MPLPGKKQIFLDALDQTRGRAGTALVLLDHTWPGVDVPDEAERVDDVKLALRYSWRFAGQPAADDDGIRCSLSFGGVEHMTYVPWGAVMAIQEDASGVVVSFPSEMKGRAAEPVVPVRPKLQLVK